MDRHNAIFVISSYTKMVFANMKMEGKDFSGKVTPLFETMIVQAPEDMGKGLEIPTDPHHTPIVTQPSSSPPLHQVVRFLMRKVLDLEEAKTAQVKEIASLKKRVKKLEHKRKSRASGLKRLRNAGSTRRVEYSSEASLELVKGSDKAVEGSKKAEEGSSKRAACKLE
nr:hypothetical protein [Tanacetum cinerariifolium]